MLPPVCELPPWHSGVRSILCRFTEILPSPVVASQFASIWNQIRIRGTLSCIHWQASALRLFGCWLCCLYLSSSQDIRLSNNNQEHFGVPKPLLIHTRICKSSLVTSSPYATPEKHGVCVRKSTKVMSCWDVAIITLRDLRCCSLFSSFGILRPVELYLFPVALQANADRGLLILEVSKSHSDAPQSVGLLGKSYQLVAETSTWQHTTLTTDRHPCLRRDSKPGPQQASCRKPTP